MPPGGQSDEFSCHISTYMTAGVGSSRTLSSGQSGSLGVANSILLDGNTANDSAVQCISVVGPQPLFQASQCIQMHEEVGIKADTVHMLQDALPVCPSLSTACQGRVNKKCTFVRGRGWRRRIVRTSLPLLSHNQPHNENVVVLLVCQG